jgi:hypothetical protein
MCKEHRRTKYLQMLVLPRWVDTVDTSVVFSDFSPLGSCSKYLEGGAPSTKQACRYEIPHTWRLLIGKHRKTSSVNQGFSIAILERISFGHPSCYKISFQWCTTHLRREDVEVLRTSSLGRDPGISNRLFPKGSNEPCSKSLTSWQQIRKC